MKVCRALAISVLTSLIVCNCHANTEHEKDTENTLRNIYEQKLVSLRNPYFGKTLIFDSAGAPTNHVVAGPWSTCGLLRVHKFRVGKDGVEIDGKRVILALRSDEADQKAVPIQTQAIPVETEQNVRIRIQISPMNLEQVKESLPKIFQGGQLIERVAAYWKPTTHDLEAFRKSTPNGIVGNLEGNRPVYLVNPGTVSPPKPIRTPDPEYTEGARGTG